MRTIAHSYDTYDHAVRVVTALQTAGVPQEDISLVSGDKDRTVATSVAGDTAAQTGTGAGTGASVGTLLGGGAGLLAGLGALAIPGVGPVVAAGWLIATLTGAGIGAAAGGLLGSLTGAGISETDAKAYADHVGRGGTLVTVRASDTMATEAEYILEHGEARIAPAMTPPAAALAPAPLPTASTGGDTIQLVKEDLVVGKRIVEQGGLRVTKRVVETPVQEQVSLHEERVVVDRRPIDQSSTAVPADAFQERTLMATASGEEAVVSKTARVVEEVGLRKQVSERAETVRDTVRETKLAVEEVAGSTSIDTTTSVAGQPGGLRDNVATRVTDNSLGTNLSGENPTRKL